MIGVLVDGNFAAMDTTSAMLPLLGGTGVASLGTKTAVKAAVREAATSAVDAAVDLVRATADDAVEAASEGATYLIEDGIKRAKAVEQAKGAGACILCEVYDDAGNLTDVKDIPVGDLRSPYGTLDLSSGKTRSRWEYAKQNVDNPNNPPPRVFEGNQGTPIPEVEIVE